MSQDSVYKVMQGKGWLTSRAIADLTGLGIDSVKSNLRLLAHRGDIEREFFEGGFKWKSKIALTI